MRPPTSWPSVNGSDQPSASAISAGIAAIVTSEWHSPLPATSTRTSPGPGSGTGATVRRGGAPHSTIRNAGIVGPTGIGANGGISGPGRGYTGPVPEAPFTHGVASFDPTAESVLLWARAVGDGRLRWRIAPAAGGPLVA